MSSFKGVGAFCNIAGIVSVHALCRTSMFLSVGAS